jgi:hypothetical protein
MTLSDLRTALRDIIDQPNTSIFGNTQLNRFINDALRDVYQEIITRNPMYLYKSSTVATTANSYFTALPSDCVAVNRLVNSNGETLARMYTSNMDMAESTAEPIYFSVVGPNIHWWPKPGAAYTFTIYYHYLPADLSTDSSSPTLPYGYHDIVAWGAAIKTRIAKEDKVREYYDTYGSKLQNLLRVISIDTTNEAPRVKGSSHDFYIYNS